MPELYFTFHAVARCIERGISEGQIIEAVTTGVPQKEHDGRKVYANICQGQNARCGGLRLPGDYGVQEEPAQPQAQHSQSAAREEKIHAGDTEMIRYLSVCSGIEAASVAWKPLGWEPVAFSEVEKFPCSVLARHYPDVPNLGDMTQIDGEKYHGTVDLLVGGTPCQGFSVAGKRAGMADPRSGLALAFVNLVRAVSPRWIGKRIDDYERRNKQGSSPE